MSAAKKADLEARVAALERALSVVLVHLPAAFLDAQDVADLKTRKVLEDLEQRLAAGAALARVLLPEEAHDEAFDAWEALPKAAPLLWRAANEKLGERFVELGIVGADELRVTVPVVTIDADAVHRTRGLMPKGGAGR